MVTKIQQLYQSFLLLKKEDDVKRFLSDLLTEAEIKEFANRLRVAQLLDSKTPYEAITKETGMSSTTIARIQKWLSGALGGQLGYRLVLDRMNQSLHHHTLLAGR